MDSATLAPVSSDAPAAALTPTSTSAPDRKTSEKLGKEKAATPRLEDQPSSGPSTSQATAHLTPGRKFQEGPPALEPWMKQTVVLRLKEVEGRIPEMTAETFGRKMVMEQGFSRADTLSIQSFALGLFYVTFASIAICKRYWEMVQNAIPDSPFTRFVGNCPIQREERRVTIAMRNPHTPGKDISTFLKRFCTVVREPTQIQDGNGFWTGKWSVIVRLWKDNASPNGLQHLPQSFSLGNSAAILHYPDQPKSCRRCGAMGHVLKDCKEAACRNCRVTGHETKDCPRKKTCNLCGQTSHVYKDCPQRQKSYAAVASNSLHGGGSKPNLPADRKQKLKSPPAAPGAAQVIKKKEKKDKEGKTKNSTPPPSTLPPSITEAAPLSHAASEPSPPPPPLTLNPEDFPPLVAPTGNRTRKRRSPNSPQEDQRRKKTAELPAECPQQEDEETQMEEEPFLEAALNFQPAHNDMDNLAQINRLLQIEDPGAGRPEVPPDRGDD